MSESELLTIEEERALAARFREKTAAGDAVGAIAARNELVERNLAFVQLMAGRLLSSRPELAARGITRRDLFQVGAIGLARAAEKYAGDHASGARFITYAGPWVRNAFQHEIQDFADPIRLPCYVHTLRMKYGRLSRELGEDAARARFTPLQLRALAVADAVGEVSGGLGFDGFDAESAEPARAARAARVAEVDRCLRMLDPVEERLLRRSMLPLAERETIRLDRKTAWRLRAQALRKMRRLLAAG